MTHRARTLLTLLTATIDVAAAIFAFFLAYRLRGSISFPTALKLAPVVN